MKLAKVKVQPGESIDDALKKFNNKVKRSGDLKAYKSHQYYVKPGLQKRLKAKESKAKKKDF